MTLIYALIAVALLYSAHKATRVKGLLNAALWLAATSCLTAILMYIMGSPGIAVIELSVGAGLVTVLFVFAISIIGDEKIESKFFIPPLAALLMATIPFIILAFLWISGISPVFKNTPADILANTIWEDRKVDLYLQAALIITGILGIMLLIAPSVANRFKKERDK